MKSKICFITSIFLLILSIALFINIVSTMNGDNSPFIIIIKISVLFMLFIISILFFYFYRKMSDEEKVSTEAKKINTIFEEKLSTNKEEKLRIEGKIKELISPVVNSKVTVFHSILMDKIPMDDWTLSASNNDTAESLCVKRKTMEVVKNHLYDSTDAEENFAYTDLISEIVEECIEKNLYLKKSVIKEIEHKTDGKYLYQNSSPSISFAFGNRSIVPIFGINGRTSIYVPGEKTSLNYTQMEDETVLDIRQRILDYFDILGKWCANYIVKEIIPFLNNFFPKEKLSDIWHTVYEWYKFDTIPNFKQYLLDKYAETDEELKKCYDRLNYINAEIKKLNKCYYNSFTKV